MSVNLNSTSFTITQLLGLPGMTAEHAQAIYSGPKPYQSLADELLLREAVRQ